MRSLRLTAKAREPICVIFGTLQCRFILNASVDSSLSKFITKSSGHLAKVGNPNFRFRRLQWEFQHKMLSRTNLERLLNKTGSSGVSKDGKKEAVHGLLDNSRIANSRTGRLADWTSRELVNSRMPPTTTLCA